ncbi:DNA topology modulation protein FlaR [Halobacillus sp. HZG1]|uniref:DNA topology modulation protein FlaR n=1 Tax=Halobacillus sp. HZG1 TaxID=3111769 RepID=UPI002DBD64B8|nr:DNA topology modulation protein FlaR [Halobacillus sp. HZG1]MEC3885352.1 DNA topology modulation protein FlaR [Halobacillus sp. HZG1]
MRDIKKIHIIGSVASGKTTLARKLSKEWELPYYELDNVVWERHQTGDIRRTEEERAEYLKQVACSEGWIVEGVHNEWWVEDSFRHADVIIFLDTNYSVRTYRIIKRFILQKLRLEKAHYTPTFRIFLKMFKWNKYFEENGKPHFFQEYQEFQDKVIKVDTVRELRDRLYSL